MAGKKTAKAKPTRRASSEGRARDGKTPATPGTRAASRLTQAGGSAIDVAAQARAVLERSSWRRVQQEQLSQECRRLLAQIERTCAGIIPVRPVKSGEIAGEIPIEEAGLRSVMAAAMGGRGIEQVVWTDGTNELLVFVAKVSVALRPGFVDVLVPVSCEETGTVTITVTFASGSAEAPAGLLFAAFEDVAGPEEIVELWGEALTAFAWSALLRSLSTLADVAGVDVEGAGLVPAGFEADRGGARLTVIGRHAMDRVAR